MKFKHFIPYTMFAIQARKLHKQWNVSASYMEIVLRIEWHNKVERWSQERYNRELIALALRFPKDWKNHMEAQKRKEKEHARTEEIEPSSPSTDQEEA